MILQFILAFIFALLGGIHFYWAFGGKWGINVTFPTKESLEEPIIKPPLLATIIVGIGLCAMALFYIHHAGLLEVNIPNWVSKYGQWVIPSIFLIRAIGDFRYVGFFKTIKKTKFAKMDSKLFSPLCAFIAILGFAIAINI